MVEVSSLCRNCGQKKPTKGFTMSLEVGKMVCAECAKTLKGTVKPHVKNEYKPLYGQPVVKSKISSSTPTKNVPVAPSPVKKVANDFDEEDRELERMDKKKQAAVQSGSYRCPGCGYMFKMNASVGKVYHTCPFCKKHI